VAVPLGVHADRTVIWFIVSVPVLSVQMKVVEPNVSTASRLRTSTCRSAIRSAPHANESVTVGSSASGTNATVTPIANTNPSDGSLPNNSAIPKKNAPTPTATPAMVRTTWCSPTVSGVTGLAVTVASAAIVANRVAPPVAVTTAAADPSTTNVPANSGSFTAPGDGTLSPVSNDVSTKKQAALSTTASAGTRSPASTSSTSPTTTSSASTITGRPPRRTVTMVGSS